jgi:hypothetical protein
MPLCAASNYDFTLDGRLAGLAARREEFVEVEMAVEAQALIAVVFGSAAGVVGDVGAVHAGLDPGDPFAAGGLGLWVEGDAFEAFRAVVAAEALGVETDAGGADDAAGDWERALVAEGGAALVWTP